MATTELGLLAYSSSQRSTRVLQLIQLSTHRLDPENGIDVSLISGGSHRGT